MRFIDPDKAEELLPPDWAEKVQAANDYVAQKIEEARLGAVADGKDQQQVEALMRKAKSKAITNKSEIWRTFAESVKSLSHDKCWYCESLEDRSHMPVDHYRPKGGVTECPEHEGYWWLAFDWKNYRYCCTFCNSQTSGDDTTGGKQNHFPILNPPNWIKEEDGDLGVEQPALIDPFDFDSPPLITFHENGFPREVNQDKNSKDYKKANISIGIYHLHHSKSVKSRKRIAIKIRNLVTEIDELRAASLGGAGNDVQRKARLKDLAKLISEDAPYRTAARLYLKGNAKDNNQHWIQDLLNRV